jgi:hypothetical protein
MHGYLDTEKRHVNADQETRSSLTWSETDCGMRRVHGTSPLTQRWSGRKTCGLIRESAASAPTDGSLLPPLLASFRLKLFS